MLAAEIHGHSVPEARNSEDYLTSTVFGHLRYIQPGPFWDALFELACSEPIGQERINASEYIRQKSGAPLAPSQRSRRFFGRNTRRAFLT
jgi:hypothetical protein